MAEDIPDWAREPATKPAADEDVPAWAQEPPGKGFWGGMIEQVGRGWETITQAPPQPAPGITSAIRAPRLLKGVGEIVEAPFTGISEAVESAFPRLKQAQQQGQILPLERPGEVLATALNLAEPAGLRAAAPGFRAPAGYVLPSRPVLPPEATPPTVGRGMVATAGEATGDQAVLAYEQKARSGVLGEAAQRHAQAFDQLRANIELPAEREAVMRGLDPQARVPPPSPQVTPLTTAATRLGEEVRSEAERSQGAVRAGYQQAEAAGGEITAGWFGGQSARIRQQASAGTNPVVISRVRTPNAAVMMRDLEMPIEQRITPYGPPRPIDPFTGQPEPMSGVSLSGVDEMRKRLQSFRSDALRSGDATDIRAANRIMTEFDTDIDRAVNSGEFSGDPRAVQLWNEARARHSAYRATFGGAGGRDPVGRIVQRIIGDATTPAATANEIADFITGSSNLVPKQLTVPTVRRLRDIVGGPASDTWSEVKQGVFSRAIEPPPGVTAFTDKQVADRVADLVGGRGSDVASEIYSAADLDLIRAYGEMRRKIQTPAHVNVPATVERIKDRMLRWLVGHIGSVLARGAAHLVGLGFIGETVAGPIAQYIGGRLVQARTAARDARQIQRQMPIIGNVLRDYQNAVLAWQLKRGAANAARVTVALRNLDRNARAIGIEIGDLISSQVAQQPATQPAAAVPTQPVQQDQGPIGE